MHFMNETLGFNFFDDEMTYVENRSNLHEPRVENFSHRQKAEMESFATEAQKCLIYLWTPPFPEEVFCNATWDGVMCLPAVPINTTVASSCENFISHQVNITDTFAHRICNPVGAWVEELTAYVCFLMVYYPVDDQMEAHERTSLASTLMFIYFYGGIVSCVLLTATMFIFSYFRMLQCSRISIHKNLVLSFILRFLVVIILFEPFISEDRIDKRSYRDFDWLCKLIIILAYYTLLANVSWMLVEGVFLHGRVTTSVFNAHPPFKIYHFIGWVLPALIVGVWAICLSESNSQHCWINSFELPTSWIIMAPVAIFLTLNLIFLISIIRIMVTKLGANRTMEMNRIRKAVKATTVLFPLLGATNMLYIIDEQRGDTYRITNAVLQSSQGIFVSVIYCFLNDEVKMAILRKWQMYRNRRIDTRRRSSSAAKTSAKHLSTNYSSVDRSTQFLRSKLNVMSSSLAPPAVIRLEQYK